MFILRLMSKVKIKKMCPESKIEVAFPKLFCRVEKLTKIPPKLLNLVEKLQTPLKCGNAIEGAQALPRQRPHILPFTKLFCFVEKLKIITLEDDYVRQVDVRKNEKIFYSTPPSQAGVIGISTIFHISTGKNTVCKLTKIRKGTPNRNIWEIKGRVRHLNKSEISLSLLNISIKINFFQALK